MVLTTQWWVSDYLDSCSISCSYSFRTKTPHLLTFQHTPLLLLIAIFYLFNVSVTSMPITVHQAWVMLKFHNCFSFLAFSYSVLLFCNVCNSVHLKCLRFLFLSLFSCIFLFFLFFGHSSFSFIMPQFPGFVWGVYTVFIQTCINTLCYHYNKNSKHVPVPSQNKAILKILLSEVISFACL